MINAWHLYYLVGATLGFVVSIFIIRHAVYNFIEAPNWRKDEAKSNVVWSIVGSLLIPPLGGVVLSGFLFLLWS